MSIPLWGTILCAKIYDSCAMASSNILRYSYTMSFRSQSSLSLNMYTTYFQLSIKFLRLFNGGNILYWLVFESSLYEGMTDAFTAGQPYQSTLMLFLALFRFLVEGILVRLDLDRICVLLLANLDENSNRWFACMDGFANSYMPQRDAFFLIIYFTFLYISGEGVLPN